MYYIFFLEMETQDLCFVSKLSEMVFSEMVFDLFMLCQQWRKRLAGPNSASASHSPSICFRKWGPALEFQQEFPLSYCDSTRGHKMKCIVKAGKVDWRPQEMYCSDSVEALGALWLLPHHYKNCSRQTSGSSRYLSVCLHYTYTYTHTDFLKFSLLEPV